MTSERKLLLDILERAVFTWVEAFVGLLAAAQVFSPHTQPGAVLEVLSAMQVAAIAALPAALTVIKGGVSALITSKKTASALPAAADPGA